MPINTEPSADRRRLHAKGVAEYLGVTERWIRRKGRSPEIPFLKLGR